MLQWKHLYCQVIKFDDVHKGFGLTDVLSGIDLTIQSGELVTIIGPSGVGKSTLLHLLIGALKPDSGSITIDGVDISQLKGDDLQLFRRSMGMVFQDYKLLPKKTVWENIAFALEVCGADQATVENKVPLVLRKVGLKNAEHKFPHQLSGGEQQKVAIARGLVHDPALLIADELTGNLDPPSTNEIINILDQLHRDGLTIVLATHSKKLVNTLRPRVILLKNGNIDKDIQQSGFLEF